jgi:hypothetical protein
MRPAPRRRPISIKALFLAFCFAVATWGLMMLTIWMALP